MKDPAPLRKACAWATCGAFDRSWTVLRPPPRPPLQSLPQVRQFQTSSCHWTVGPCPVILPNSIRFEPRTNSWKRCETLNETGNTQTLPTTIFTQLEPLDMVEGTMVWVVPRPEEQEMVPRVASRESLLDRSHSRPQHFIFERLCILSSLR